ncbi:MAG: hypothetical protein ACLQVY_11205 [Limisphaerales bacterium]
MIDAARFYAARQPDKITRCIVAEVLIELLTAKKAHGKSDRYFADLRIRLGRLAKDWPFDIGSIPGPDIQGWLDRLKMAPRSVANFRTCLGTLFGFAESRGYVFERGNPIVKVESTEISGDGVIEIYTPEELSNLLNSASVAFVPFIAISAFAGLRTAEIERLKWQDVCSAGRQSSKGKCPRIKRRHVGWCSPLMAVMFTRPMLAAPPINAQASKGVLSFARLRIFPLCPSPKFVWIFSAPP